MKIEQVDLTNANALDILASDNTYLVRFSTSKTKRADRKSMPEMPYGLAFKSLTRIPVNEIMETLNSGEGAIVRVTK